ncbi:methyltransferase [Sphingomonas jatrophae]|uniref:Methylase of polypeptide chain release factors n=1 Tax=Sphingomonas jatrophae TaxID=1166337 RepID=A0A1I6JNZ7_9SPHN|nr:class I SAM-dependent methyltransferase [Sphingomonas jatrophae]SFR80621.1 Methylase of polypeptide chain release factors [Sphingomonas jatrophae]
MTHHPDSSLGELLTALKARNYRFVTPTPATHARIVARPDRREARSLADVLGWSLPFAPDLLDADIRRLLDAAGALEEAEGGLLRSCYRVSSLHDQLYIHSAFPTDAEDSVFFGPDSYRFADAIVAELEGCPRRHGAQIVDIGTGAGVGAIVTATRCPDASVVMTDVNPRALRLARINARAAGVEAQPLLGADLTGVEGEIDVALANPPYIIDEAGRTYRDGGGMHGGEVSLDMARMALPRLAPGGRFLLYTGSAIVRGEDELHQALIALAGDHGMSLRYREIDPDVFGEELETEAYADVDRIALVTAVVTRPD